MFLLDVKESERVLLELASTKNGMPVERLVRLAFLKGLRLMAKAYAEPKTLAQESAVGHTLCRSPDEARAYIREHWKVQTDKEMGDALGYTMHTVRGLRLGLGLQRKRGPSSGATGRVIATAASQTSAEERRNQRFAPLDALIRLHWQTANDGDIGRMLTPPVSRIVVMNRRKELGLLRERGGKRAVVAAGKSVREAIDGEEFERMVLREGYSMIEYITVKKLRCSRERLRQVVEDLGLRHSIGDRAPEWNLARRARKLGKPDLANREWLAKKVRDAVSIAALAAELAITEADLFLFVRGFNLSHPLIRKHGADTVQLVCAKCGKKFLRLKTVVETRKRNANGKQLDFYCDAVCAGKYDRTAARVRREANKSPAAQRLEMLRAEKMERESAFIRSNWLNMSDQELAHGLGCTVKALENKRRALGLKRK